MMLRKQDIFNNIGKLKYSAIPKPNNEMTKTHRF